MKCKNGIKRDEKERGAYLERVHAVLNLDDPRLEVVKLGCHRILVLGMLDRGVDTKHARGGPPVAYSPTIQHIGRRQKQE